MAKIDDITKLVVAENKQLYSLYESAYKAVIQSSAVKSAMAKGDTFSFAGNASASRQAARIMSKYNAKIVASAYNGITAGWSKGEDAAGKLVTDLLGGTTRTQKQVDAINQAAVNAQRMRGMTGAKYATEAHGMNLSQRIWKANEGALKEIESIIQNGLKEGKSAAQISQSVRKYLNNPDALYRSVMNKKTGQLELSENAKNYHPGQGVYRSAYKNAMRLVRTETNAAYRRAQILAWSLNPLIKAYEIRLSNNHTTTVNGKTVPLRDMCDDLAGIYPKTFMWEGWHPQCRCTLIPIVISTSEFGNFAKAIKEQKAWTAPTTVTELPDNFKKWLEDNKDRLAASQQQPYFVSENQGIINAVKNATVVQPVETKPVEQKTLTTNITDAQENAKSIKNEEITDVNTFNKLIDKAEGVPVVQKILQKGLQFITGREIDVFLKEIDVDMAKLYSKELVKLCSEYKLEQLPFRTFSTEKHLGYYGAVSVKKTLNFNTTEYDYSPKEMNVSARFSQRTPDHAGFASRCDADRLQTSTLTHEFGHNIFMKTGKFTSAESEFYNQLKKLQSAYKKDIISAMGSKDFDSLTLGDYASTNTDEFMAEAFQEYKNCSHPTKYARLVGKLIDKYFKK
jgi:hypothetical protein